jgi:hypothetical protein
MQQAQQQQAQLVFAAQQVGRFELELILVHLD